MDLFNRVYARVTTALALMREQEGQTFTEYAIIVATIAVGTVLAVTGLRNAVITALGKAAGDI